MSEPNFQRLRTALLCGEPDRVPLAELKIEDEVKAAFLGRPMAAPVGQSASRRIVSCPGLQVWHTRPAEGGQAPAVLADVLPRRSAASRRRTPVKRNRQRA